MSRTRRAQLEARAARNARARRVRRLQTPAPYTKRPAWCVESQTFTGYQIVGGS